MATAPKRQHFVIAALALVAVVLIAVGLLARRSATGDAKNSPPRTSVFDAGEQRTTTRQRPVLAPRKGSGAHNIAGWVRGSDGGAIAMAQISATMELGPGVTGGAPDVGHVAVIVANSSDNGAFVLEGLEPGRYRLSIEGQGLVTAELRFVDAPGDGLVILVSREVRVRGRLIGAPVPATGVRVFLRSETATQQREMAIRDDGSFEFSGLAEGRFQLWAQGPGQAAPTQWIDRVGVQEFADVALTMQEAYTVSGRVVDEGRSEFGVSANVVVHSANGVEPSRRAVSKADGSFEVEGLLAGRWIAEASAPGYLASGTQAFAAESKTALLLTLDSGGQVSGVVRSSGGGPLAGASVQLVGKGTAGSEVRYSAALAVGDSVSTLASGQRFVARGELGVLLGPIPLVPPPGAFVSRVATTVGSTDDAELPEAAVGRPSQFTTDSLGRYHIAGVQPGTYRVHVSHPDFADAVSKSARIIEGGKPAVRNVTLRAGTRLSGTVLNDKGVAVVGASVFARFSDDRDQAMTVTDSDGAFAFAPLSGAVELVVESVGYGRVVQKHKLSVGGLVAATKHLEIRLVEANAVMKGRVVDDSGFPVPDAAVAVVEDPTSLPVRPARTDSDGLFRLDGLMPGTHRVHVAHSEFPPLEVRVAAAPNVEITLPLGADLDVRVADAQSQAPLAMADLVVMHSKDGHEVRAVTDAQGRAEFRALAPGTYTMRARLAGYASTPRSVRLVKRSSRTTAPQQEVVELARGSILAGILLSEGGDRVIGATLSVGESRSVSDSEGRFRLVDVPGGAIEIAIEKSGTVATEELQVEVGEERVTMELRFLPDEPEEGEASSGGDDEESESGDSDADDESVVEE